MKKLSTMIRSSLTGFVNGLVPVSTGIMQSVKLSAGRCVKSQILNINANDNSYALAA